MPKVRFLAFYVLCLSLQADPKTESGDVKKISTAMGHLIGKNLQTLGLSLDFEAIVKGLKEAANGEPSPLSEEECAEAIALMQEEAVSKKTEENTTIAENFLKETALKPEVLSLVEGKILYSVQKKGTGDVVFSYNSPIVRYFGKTLSGKEIAVHEECMDLQEAAPVFRNTICGMKEGEIRTVYVHPEELFYDNEDSSLAILEIELIKADSKNPSKNEEQLFPKEIDRQLR